jgi:hypothetical protein
MRGQHMGGGQQSHPVRNFLLGVLIIFAALAFAPDLGASHAPGPTSHGGTTQNALGDALGHSDEVQNWTVFKHLGYNGSFECWILRLNGGRSGYDPVEETGDYCAKDKADYDSHPDGSSYQTKGSWFDNLTPPDNAPRSPDTDTNT